MNKKSFLFIIEDLYGGGAQRSLINTAEGLRVRGHSVTVFILRDLIEHHIPTELKIVNLAIVNQFTKAFSNVWLEKIQAKFISSKIREISPDVILSCSCDKITRHIQHSNIWYWIKSNMLASRYTEQEKIKAKRKLIRFYDGKKVIGCSQGIIDSLLNEVGLKASETRVIYNPYDQREFIEKAAERVELPKQDFFISVGTFEHRKRHDRLLEAYKDSRVTTPLVIMGKGKKDEEEQLRLLVKKFDIEDKVIILGYKKNPYPFIAHAKALILTSDGEGLPRVLIEALLLQTPVISVDCPSGPSEILTGNLKPFLVPMNDIKKLAMAIKTMDTQSPLITTENYSKFLSENVIPKFESL